MLCYWQQSKSSVDDAIVPQERCTDSLADLALSRPDLRELALLAMAAVGRGGQGDVGQRIRDEILTVQSRNNAKVRRPCCPAGLHYGTSKLSGVLLLLLLSHRAV